MNAADRTRIFSITPLNLPSSLSSTGGMNSYCMQKVFTFHKFKGCKASVQLQSFKLDTYLALVNANFSFPSFQIGLQKVRFAVLMQVCYVCI